MYSDGDLRCRSLVDSIQGSCPNWLAKQGAAGPAQGRALAVGMAVTGATSMSWDDLGVQAGFDASQSVVFGGVKYEFTGGVLGSGAFGCVYDAESESGERVAVKVLDTERMSAWAMRQYESECQLWALAGEHEHIVRYLGTEKSDACLCIFLEYVPGGSIASMLAQFGVFGEPLIRLYTRQILEGVTYLHTMGIIHRDIKGANVLVTDAGVAKLADFGCSKQLQGLRTNTLEESLNAIKGSVPWMAPEVIKQAGHGRSADVWSVGATAIEMASAKHPWPQFSNNLAALFQIATMSEPPQVPSSLSPCGHAFLGRCMVLNPRERASAAELLRHEFCAAPSDGEPDPLAADIPRVSATTTAVHVP